MRTTAEQRQGIGRFGEQVAATHLVAQGMVLLDRNWRCPDGEIDLVLRDGEVLVVCEVKTRSTDDFGPPVAAVTRQKVDRLQVLALRWLEEHAVSPDQVRLDVVGVLRRSSGAALVDHVRGVS